MGWGGGGLVHGAEWKVWTNGGGRDRTWGGTAEGGADCEWCLLGYGTRIVETGTDVSDEPDCSSFKVEEWDMGMIQPMAEAAGISETLLPRQ